MGFNRYARKNDQTHRPVVDGLRAQGIKVYEVGRPVDIFCYFWCKRHEQHCWAPLEIKTPQGVRNPRAKRRNDRPEQNQFMDETRTPMVVSVTEALLALSLHGIVDTTEPVSNNQIK